MVLLPKVDFRLKATTLSQKECLRIMAPFKRLFKHSLTLTIATPNDLLHSQLFLNLSCLYQRHITSHAARLAKVLTMDDDSWLKRLYLHRFHLIQTSLHITFSPLLLDQFSSFIKLPISRLDYLFRLLQFTSSYNIRFAQSSQPLSAIDSHTPIYTLFQNDPSLYAKSVYLLKKHNIRYLSDCIAPDGLSISPFRDVIFRNSEHPPSQIIPKWYHHIVKSTAVHKDSLRLAQHYQIAQRSLPLFTALEDSFYSELETIHIPSRQVKNSFWCATWDTNTNSPIFGRVVKNSPSIVHIQHWVNNTPTPSMNTTSSLTPQSQPLQLIACTGCTLHDATASRHGSRVDSRIVDIPCLFKAPHSSYMDLKHLQYGQAKFNRLESHNLNIAPFQLLHYLQEYFTRPHLTQHHPPGPYIPSPLEDEVLEYGLYFLSGSTLEKFNLNPRWLVKAIFAASTFNQLISLSRWQHIRDCHFTRQIDWSITSKVFTLNRLLTSNTSFEHSSRTAFTVKLLMNELPLLANLQTSRRPDLYKAHWKCIFCQADYETWSHLWFCRQHHQTLISLMYLYKNTIQVMMEEFSSHPIESLRELFISNSWTNLSSWTYPTESTILTCPTFEFIVKGIIPKDLTDIMATTLPKTKIMQILCKSTKTIQDAFRNQVWLPRCIEFTKFKARQGITTRQKHLPARTPTRIPSSTNQVIPLSTDWKKWIAASLTSGLNWMDFAHLH